jgi:CBS domain-containing protein
MAHLSDILSKKRGGVITVTPDASVLDAATRMNAHKIGALVVLDGPTVVGIITERDILQRLVAAQHDPARTRVRQVMTTDVVCGEPAMNLDAAREIFMTQRIRHLPVVDDDGQLLGIVSIGDLNAWDLDGARVTIRYLHEYLYAVR